MDITYKTADNLIGHGTVRLACVLGINEYLLLRVIQNRLRGSNHVHDDRRWVYNTYKDWHNEIPCLSVSTIRRAVENLESQGVLIRGNYNQKKYDQTRWYSIDYPRLLELDEAYLDQNHLPKLNIQSNPDANMSRGSDPLPQKSRTEIIRESPGPLTKLGRPIPENNSVKEFCYIDIRFQWEIEAEANSDVLEREECGETYDSCGCDQSCELPKAQVPVAPSESVTTPFLWKANWYGTPNLMELKQLDVFPVARLLTMTITHKDNRAWTLCPNHADSDPSLNLNEKSKKEYRVFAKCHVCESVFDSVGLVTAVLGLKFNAACDWLAEHFGIEPPEPPKKRRARSPLPPDAIKYWEDHAMRIEDLPRDKVYFNPDFYKNLGGAWMFKHPTMPKKWIGRVLYPPDKKRKYRFMPGSKNAIFKMGPENPKRVYMPEGMPDTVVLHDKSHWSAWSTMAGAGSWPEGHLSEFLTVDEVIIFPDADGPGKDGAARKARLIKQYGCKVYIVPLPDGIHDVSDFFVKGGTVEQLKNLVDDVLPQETENLKDVFGTAWWEEASAP